MGTHQYSCELNFISPAGYSSMRPSGTIGLKIIGIGSILCIILAQGKYQQWRMVFSRIYAIFSVHAASAENLVRTPGEHL